MPSERELERAILNPSVPMDDIEGRLREIGAKYGGRKEILDKYMVSYFTGKVFRTRLEGGQSYLTHKEENLGRGDEKDRVENNILIDGFSSFDPFVAPLGLESKAVISKTREKYSLPGLKVDLDRNVKAAPYKAGNLGDYVLIGDRLEVEYTKEQDFVELMAALGLGGEVFDRRDAYDLARETALHEYDDVHRGFDYVLKLVREARAKKKGPVMVGIGGASASGKSYLAERFAEAAGGEMSVSLVSLDDYYKDGAVDMARSLGNNYDHPSLIDFDAALRDLASLKAGDAVQVPKYSFKTGRREGSQTVGGAGLIVVEGIYALKDNLRGLYDVTCSVFSDSHLSLVRRITRDVSRTGNDEDWVLNQVARTVMPMYKMFIEPDLKTADVKINNSFNPLEQAGRRAQVKVEGDNRVLDDVFGLALYTSATPYVRRVQSDEVFMPQGSDRMDHIIRVREEGGRHTLCFKYGEGYRSVYECAVSPNAASNLLILGYRYVGKVSKTRLENSVSAEWSEKPLAVKQDIVDFERPSGAAKGRDKTPEISHIFLEIEGRPEDVAKAVERIEAAGEKATAKSYAEMLYEGGLPLMKSL